MNFFFGFGILLMIIGFLFIAIGQNIKSKETSKNTTKFQQGVSYTTNGCLFLVAGIVTLTITGIATHWKFCLNHPNSPQCMPPPPPYYGRPPPPRRVPVFDIHLGGPHRGPPLGPHRGPPLGPHRGPPLGPHRGPPLGPHRGPRP